MLKAMAPLAALLTACGVGPQAPTLDSVSKMSGGLMVEWTNKEVGCDTVEVERKMMGEPYGMVFTLAGDINNKHDTAATGDMDYSYRLRCHKANLYSAYSNEKTANPVR